MTTQAEEFQRIHSYLQAQGERYTFSELWARQIRARIAVMDAVEGVTQEQAEFRPDPDEWSIAEVLHHLLTSSERVAETVDALSRGESINPGRIDPPREETSQTIGELTEKLREDSIAWTALTQKLPASPPTEPTAPTPCSASCTPGRGTSSSVYMTSTTRARSRRTSNRLAIRAPRVSHEDRRQRND